MITIEALREQHAALCGDWGSPAEPGEPSKWKDRLAVFDEGFRRYSLANGITREDLQKRLAHPWVDKIMTSPMPEIAHGLRRRDEVEP